MGKLRLSVPWIWFTSSFWFDLGTSVSYYFPNTEFPSLCQNSYRPLFKKALRAHKGRICPKAQAGPGIWEGYWPSRLMGSQVLGPPPPARFCPALPARGSVHGISRLFRSGQFGFESRSSPSAVISGELFTTSSVTFLTLHLGQIISTWLCLWGYPSPQPRGEHGNFS